MSDADEQRYKAALELILRRTKGREMGMVDVTPVRVIASNQLVSVGFPVEGSVNCWN